MPGSSCACPWPHLPPAAARPGRETAVEHWQDPPGAETAVKLHPPTRSYSLDCFLHAAGDTTSRRPGTARPAHLRPPPLEDSGELFQGVKEPVCVGASHLDALPLTLRPVGDPVEELAVDHPGVMGQHMADGAA